MKTKFGILVILMFLTCITVSAQEWEQLFNGKDLSNWQKLNGDAEFVIEDGAIVGISKTNTPNTFLATKENYSDFILEYEVKLTEELNSGVMIRGLSTPDYKDGRVHSYQVELDPSARAWSGGIYDEARRGWLYNMENNPSAKKAYTHKEWNKFRAEVIGNSIRVWLNGIQMCDLVDDMTKEGFIALQVHSINDEAMAGEKVSFKNIRILTKEPEKYRAKPSNEVPQVSFLTNTLTEKEKAEGWKLLWDGKTTNGWRGARLDQFPSKGWNINDGILSVEKSAGGESENGGDIVTVDKYKHFVLELDFKITKGANSGIKYFVDTELNKGEGSAIGCEFQILDDEIHPDGKKGTEGNRTLASLYDLIPAAPQYFTPDDPRGKRENKYEWNRARVVVKGKHVEHFLNGKKMVEYERSTPVWRALVARSKYVVWPNFGELEEGHILLQDHGDQVFFKNIKIKVLED